MKVDEKLVPLLRERTFSLSRDMMNTPLNASEAVLKQRFNGLRSRAHRLWMLHQECFKQDDEPEIVPEPEPAPPPPPSTPPPTKPAGKRSRPPRERQTII